MTMLHLGLTGTVYYSGFSPFLNWWKTADSETITRTAGGDLSGAAIWSAGGYLDTDTGEIVDPAPDDLLTLRRIFFARPPYAGQVTAGADYAGEEWVAEWDGTATAAFGGVTSGGSQTADGANKRLLTMGEAPGNTWLTLTLTDLDDPPRNVRVYQSRYAANVAAGETFNPDWLAVVREFGTLRFMDWQVTNASRVTGTADLATEDWHAWGQNSTAYGPKAGMPLAIMSRLANETGRPIHVCIPHQADDALVTAIATHFRDNVSTMVYYEYSNEVWNFQFAQTTYAQTQGNAIWPGDGSRNNKWYGLRSAECMAIIRGVYNDASRWRGVIGTQTVSTGVTSAILTGVAYWKSSTASSLNVSDLFESISVTGYFGDVVSCRPITSITKANPAVVTRASHGYQNGDEVKIFISAGMTELNDTYATVANRTTDTYELAGVDSTGFSDFASGNNFTAPALIFQMMDESEDRHDSDAATYPTKYTYFNQQLADSLRTGACDFGYTTNENVDELRDVDWPAQLAMAEANGLSLRQYEGGCHFVGDGYLTGFGGNPQFTEYLFASGYSEELSRVYTAGYFGFIGIGGKEPSKFVEAGSTGPFGTWAGVLYWPTEANGGTVDNNPVWAATARANIRRRRYRVQAA